MAEEVRVVFSLRQRTNEMYTGISHHVDDNMALLRYYYLEVITHVILVAGHACITIIIIL